MPRLHHASMRLTPGQREPSALDLYYDFTRQWVFAFKGPSVYFSYLFSTVLVLIGPLFVRAFLQVGCQACQT